MSTITVKDGTTIYYKDWGKGPVVTLSHGWPLNADMWDGQMMFLAEHGFLVFAEVATPAEVQMIRDEADAIASAWIAESRKKVYGVPIFIGKDQDGQPTVQRLPFTSVL